MTILTANNLSKSFGEKLLFQNISFGIDQGEKIGLIGKNGAGKSTLLKIIAGLDFADDGSVDFNKSIRIEYLTQQTEYEYDDTALDYVMNGIPEIYDIFLEYHHLIHSKNPDSDKLLELSHQIDELSGWDIEAKAKMILQKVGISDFDKSLHSASGGEKKRIALAKILISKPDLLILDEPTNHLDADTIQWLQNELSSSGLTIIFVTHDRYFLDSIATKIIELDFEKLFTYNGDYEDYLIQKHTLLAAEKSANEHLQTKYRQELAWLARGARARRTKQKSRIDWAEKLKDDIRFVENKQMKIELGKTFLGGKIIEAIGLNYSISDRKLISDFTYYAKSNDRIGIIGPNGSGKTTLLKIFAGMLRPGSGSCQIGNTVNIGYFDQENERLDESKTVLGSLQEIAEFIKVGFGRDKKITAKELLDRFLFPRNRHHSFVHTLSGGEKKRLSLLRVLMSNPNVLLLDEPTNDFDIETLGVFEKYLDDFYGVLIVVSHDRAFLDRCVEFIWSFESNGKIKEYPGNYSSYLERKDKERKKEQEIRKIIANSENSSPAKTYNQTKEKNANKLTYNEKREFENLEPEIAKLEKQLEQLGEQMNEANQDYTVYEELSRKLSELTELLEAKTARWMELAEKG